MACMGKRPHMCGTPFGKTSKRSPDTLRCPLWPDQIIKIYQPGADESMHVEVCACALLISTNAILTGPPAPSLRRHSAGPKAFAPTHSQSRPMSAPRPAQIERTSDNQLGAAPGGGGRLEKKYSRSRWWAQRGARCSCRGRAPGMDHGSKSAWRAHSTHTHTHRSRVNPPSRTHTHMPHELDPWANAA